MKHSLLELFRHVLAFSLWPVNCVVCGQNSGKGVPLCPDCFTSHYLNTSNSLSFLEPSHDRCKKCGRPLISATNTCPTCRLVPVLTQIDRVIPLYAYNVEGQELLAAWKTSGMRGLSRVFVHSIESMLRHCSGELIPPIVPVPPRPGKIREKGWDQVAELSYMLGRYCGLKIVPCLKRTGGHQQKKLDKLARKSNLTGCIEVLSGQTIPETVVLLDDLMTTGSTLETCAAALKSAGCRTVYGLTLFYD